MRLRVFSAVLACLWLIIVSGCASTDEPEPIASIQAFRTPEHVRRTVARVAERVQAEGEQSFAAMALPASEWIGGDTDAFVWDETSGTVAFNRLRPAMQGRDIAELRGEEGRRYGHWTMQALAGSRDSAWVFWRERPRGDLDPAWKAAYVTRVKGPDGRSWIVGSGEYNLRVDGSFIKDLVAMASEWIEREGPATLELARDPKGPFRYDRTAVFVIDQQGVILASVNYPDLQNRYQVDLKAAGGRPVQDAMVQALMTRQATWVSGYRGGKRIDFYVQRVDVQGRPLGVGAGLAIP